MVLNAALDLRVQRVCPFPFPGLSGNSGKLFNFPGIHFPSQTGFIMDLRLLCSDTLTVPYPVLGARGTPVAPGECGPGRDPNPSCHSVGKCWLSASFLTAKLCESPHQSPKQSNKACVDNQIHQGRVIFLS